MDIFRTWIHFLRVNVTFSVAVNVVHDVITTANLSPYTAQFMFVGVTIIKRHKSDDER